MGQEANLDDGCGTDAAAGGLFKAKYQRTLAPLLDCIDSVRSLLRDDNDIALPSIAVLGDQSTGKSSLLEGMFDIALPRGKGVVTRCPLVLQMRSAKGEPKAEISYTASTGEVVKDRPLASIADVSSAIEEATAAICGTNKGMVDSAITLRVEQEAAPNLTLIDLPGITRNPVGDQPPNIEDVVKKMIDNNIEGKATIMLCVLPSNVDFSTCDCIRIARKHDKAGERTLGVVTKIDLAEPGIRDKLEALGEEHVRLELGLIAVRNRRQEEIDAGMQHDEVRRLEQQFFQGGSVPELIGLDRRYWGMDTLETRLLEIQADCIVSALPKIRDDVRSKIRETERQLASMGTLVTSEHEAVMVLQGLAMRCQTTFHDLTQGGYGRLAAEYTCNKELYIAPKVLGVFEEYNKELSEAVSVRWFLSDECKEELRLRLDEYRGAALDNFMRPEVFELVYKQAVWSKLQGPTDKMLGYVHKCVLEVLRSLVAAESKDQARLTKLVVQQLDDFLERQASRAGDVVHDLVEAQARPFTLNHYYMDTVNKMREYVKLLKAHKAKAPSMQTDGFAFGTPSQPAPAFATSSQPTMCKELKEIASQEFLDAMACEASNIDQSIMDLQFSLAAYSKVVLKRVADVAASVVYEKLVQTVATGLQEELTSRLCRGGGGVRLLECMNDRRKATAKREREARLERLRDAYKLITIASTTGMLA